MGENERLVVRASPPAAGLPGPSYLPRDSTYGSLRVLGPGYGVHETGRRCSPRRRAPVVCMATPRTFTPGLPGTGRRGLVAVPASRPGIYRDTRPVTAPSRGGIPAGRRLRVRPRPRAQARRLAGSRPPESRRGDAAWPGCDTSQPENRDSEYLSSNVIHHASSHGRAGAGYESAESESESESPGPQADGAAQLELELEAAQADTGPRAA